MAAHIKLKRNDLMVIKNASIYFLFACLGIAAMSGPQDAYASEKQEILWKKTELQCNLDANETLCPIAFSGMNTKDMELKILSVSPSCGCVVIEKAPKAVKAQAALQITGSVYVPQAQKSVFETVAVQTQDQTYLLGISISRAVYMTIAPRSIIWQDRDLTKTVKLTLYGKERLSDLALSYDSTALRISLAKSAVKNVFDLTIIPKKKSKDVLLSVLS
jgi:Protein of unknown function (DUF1573)